MSYTTLRILQDRQIENQKNGFFVKESNKIAFNTASGAAFRGGLWDSAVKSAKGRLKKVVGETRLTYEELYTVLVQVEACLNSRPLSPLSNDLNELIPLTPVHFFIGGSSMALPQHDVRGMQHAREHLPQLQRRQKWNTVRPGMMMTYPGRCEDHQALR